MIVENHINFQLRSTSVICLLILETKVTSLNIVK